PDGQYDAVEPGPALTPHDRIDAAFATAAVRAPRPGAASLPFAVAVEVLRQRAPQHFGGYRGREVLAGAPFVQHAFLDGTPVLLLHRRGTGADLAAPRLELAELLSAVRASAVTAAEVAAAVRVLQAEWAVPPWSRAQIAAW